MKMIGTEEIIEPRLLLKLKEHLNLDNLRLYAPPRDGGDITEVLVRCECGQTRLLSEAVESGGYQKAGALGLCDGSQPWLGPFARARCE